MRQLAVGDSHNSMVLSTDLRNRVDGRSVDSKEGGKRQSCGGENRHRGNTSGIVAKAYPMTAIAEAFSRSSWGTILSSVSAAVWW
jgi:hypothetical protein